MTSSNRKFWYTSSSGRIELRMTLEQAQSSSHPGQCDKDVFALSQVPAIKTQLDAIDKDVLAAELKEFGAWDTEQLANHVENIQRILWIACGDIQEEAKLGMRQ